MPSRTRSAEPRIVDPASHPNRWVGLTVACHFLECDRRALNYFIDTKQIASAWIGRRRKVSIDALVRFKHEIQGVPPSNNSGNSISS